MSDLFDGSSAIAKYLMLFKLAAASGVVVNGDYFANRGFAPRYFAARYF